MSSKHVQGWRSCTLILKGSSGWHIIVSTTVHPNLSCLNLFASDNKFSLSKNIFFRTLIGLICHETHKKKVSKLNYSPLSEVLSTEASLKAIIDINSRFSIPSTCTAVGLGCLPVVTAQTLILEGPKSLSTMKFLGHSCCTCLLPPHHKQAWNSQETHWWISGAQPPPL